MIKVAATHLLIAKNEVRCFHRWHSGRLVRAHQIIIHFAFGLSHIISNLRMSGSEADGKANEQQKPNTGQTVAASMSSWCPRADVRKELSTFILFRLRVNTRKSENRFA